MLHHRDRVGLHLKVSIHGAVLQHMGQLIGILRTDGRIIYLYIKQLISFIWGKSNFQHIIVIHTTGMVVDDDATRNGKRTTIRMGKCHIKLLPRKDS